MTNEEFSVKKAKELVGIHPVLANVLSMNAYERGHSAGHEEVLGILSGLVADFEEVNLLLLNQKR